MRSTNTTHLSMSPFMVNCAYNSYNQSFEVIVTSPGYISYFCTLGVSSEFFAAFVILNWIYLLTINTMVM